MLDKAGEWLKESPDFANHCDERMIQVLNPPAKSDKRMMNRAEMAVQIIKRRTKAIMMDTMLAIERWPEAVDYAVHTHNLVPITRKTQHDGSGIPPLVELSNAHSPRGVSLLECDRQRQYAHPPNTLCLVHVPGRHANITNLSNSRYGLVVRCKGDIVQFRDPSRAGGPYFESKNFSEIKLAPGISPHRFIGIPSPDGPTPKVCLPAGPDDRLPTMTVIRLNFIHSNEAEWRRPVIESTTTHGRGPLPTFLTTDAAGRIMEPHDGILHPTSSYISIIPKDVTDGQHAQQEREQLCGALVNNPDWLIGRHAHKFFPEWGGVCRARVTGYNATRKLWSVQYEADDMTEEFDYDDMIKYVVDKVCGTAAADGGAALKRNAEALSNGDSVSTWGGEGQDDGEPESEPEPKIPQYTDSSVDWHSTVDNESWNEILEHCKVPSNLVRDYLRWCKTKYKIGNNKDFRKDPEALFFPSPLGIKNKNPKFNAECKFPIAEGEAWTGYLEECHNSARKVQHQIDRAYRVAEKAFQEEAYLCTRDKEVELQLAAIGPEGDPNYVSRLRQHRYRRDYIARYDMGWQRQMNAVRAASSDEGRDRAAVTTARPSKYVDINNLPIPPATTTELYKRTEPDQIKMWDEALKKEWNGLCDCEVFEHDLTKQQLYDRGVLPSKRLIGIRVIYETKVKNGKFERCKCRAVAQGFGFKKGRDFDSCFAAAPSLQSNRLLSALCAVLGWTRVTFDINQAYLLGRAPEEARFPMRYPEGWIRDKHRDKNGDERYLLCLGNIYGLPTSGRVYADERDRILMEVLRKAPPEGAGWTCKKLEYETCMYEIVATHGRILLTIHTDDADCVVEDQQDKAEFLRVMDTMFSVAGNKGIKIVDPGVMLGVHRTTLENDGVRRVKLDQSAKIEEYWAQYEDQRSKRPPASPYPVGDMHPVLDNDGKVVGVTDEEAADVLARGFKKLTGQFLWVCRNTGIAGMYAGSMMSKCSARPSIVAWQAGIHAMHYAYNTRHRGITYNSHGNLEPVCYYDSGFNQRHLCTRPQYAFVIVWAGAAVIWMSKRHPHTPSSVSEAEYCALYHAWKWVKWLREVLTDMGLGEYVKRPTMMFGDNRNARDWAIEEMTTDGNRMIDRKYRIVRERVKMGEILPVWIDGKTNPADVGTKAQANAPMTETMLSYVTGQHEIPIPEGVQVLFGPASNPTMRGNISHNTVKISRRGTARKRHQSIVTHPCIRTLQDEDTKCRAMVDGVKMHVAVKDISIPAEGGKPGLPDAYVVQKGQRFYTSNERIVIGWNRSTNPPVGRDGLPLVDVTTEPTCAPQEFL